MQKLQAELEMDKQKMQMEFELKKQKMMAVVRSLSLRNNSELKRLLRV